MTLALEAVFEDGVLKPLNPLNLPEHQKVQLVLETGSPAEASGRKLWHWQEAQEIEDQFAGEIAAEVNRQRREA